MRERLERLLTPERKRFVKFGIVGVGGVAVNLLFVWIGEQIFAGLDKSATNAAASALGIVVSIFTNFLLNDAWTWGDRPKGGRKRDFLGRMAAYFAASAIAAGLQYGCAMALNQGLAWNLYLAQLIGIAIGMVINFVLNNVYTFRDRSKGNAGAEGGGANEL